MDDVHVTCAGAMRSYGYADAQGYTGTEGTSDAGATISSSTPSWLDSGTRERKLASSCLWMERTSLSNSPAGS